MSGDDGSRPVPNSRTIVLISGSGGLPLEAAASLRAAGASVSAIGFEGVTDPTLEAGVTSMRWLELGQLEAMDEALRQLGASRLLLVGKVEKTLLFSSAAKLAPDAEAMRLLTARSDRSDEGLLASIAGWLEGRGFELLDQGEALDSMRASRGAITRHAPSDQARKDLVTGLPVLEALGRSGVGQCVVVKGGVILAVEAIEGTDDAIRRGGRLGGPGATVIKALRVGQDRRFDLPAVGPGTIEAMAEVGASALAIEAGVALVLDRERCVAQAEENGIAIWGFEIDRGGR